ncbi:hypothetical protein [Geoglobus acetivorans]|uniref:Uncharacterized protein n=1 Tax=Geoglobus acetivorans TaxID=565033 RepID=A0A0A7GDM9_GEOAI|nr:hypothetical protein GACE_0890 [Geoglobus acetivorans]
MTNYLMLLILYKKEGRSEELADKLKLDGIKLKELYRVLSHEKLPNSHLGRRVDCIAILEVEERAIRNQALVNLLKTLEKYWDVDWHIPVQKVYDEERTEEFV